MKTSSRFTALALAMLGLLGSGLSAFAEDSSQQQSMLDPAGPHAQHISDLWYIVLIPAMIVLVGVGGALVYIAFKYREKDPSFVPKQVGGNNALEFTWTLIPAMILMGIFVLTLLQTGFLRQSPAPEALRVQVTGQQWAWSFKYEDPNSKKLVSSFGTLYIPAGKVVNLDLEAKDVIHSWSVPRLSGKMDAVPGKHNYTWIEANDPGTYYGQCTEFCGLSHAQMTITVKALSEQEFNAWYSQKKQQLGGS
ncbi:MAG: cytochrome c oxidase subunit II [Candidatus Dormibacteria bacterium]